MKPLFCCLALGLLSCHSGQQQTVPGRPGGYADVLLRGMPFVKQRPDLCGEACIEMELRRLGVPLDQDDVFEIAGIDPGLGRGGVAADIARAAERIGFHTGPVWHTVKTSHASLELEALWRELHRDLGRGFPSIVCTHYDESPDTTEHFRLVVGYSAAGDEVIYHEPAESGGAYRRMPRRRFFALWPLKYSPSEWTVIRLRLEPGPDLTRRAPRSGTSRLAQQVMRLKELLEGGDYTIVVQPPFVVVGDESPGAVRERSRSTVKWAVERLKQDYFERDPDEVITVWLLRDAESYMRHSRRLFGGTPDTPYGYYSSEHRALVMNIATGGGTLVHEIVHPFMRVNFPRCPAWFNEGLGSLYEQAGERDGHIIGYTNWRLEGLQRAIHKGRLPSFEKLLSTSERQFYQQDPGTNYAQARYLCHYLQEKGLLRRFYRELRAGAASDPGGVEALKRVIGRTDLRAFQAEWQRFVLGLRFSER